MADLLIRNISEPLRTELKARASRNGRSLSDEAKDLLLKGLQESEKRRDEVGLDTFDLLRLPFANALLTEEEHRKLMEITSENRRRDSRDVPDFE